MIGAHLGAEPADIGQGAVPWVVLADPEGNAFCVMEDREVYRGTGPIAALPLDSADPEHLDVRPHTGDDHIAQRVVEWGATPVTEPSDLPWLLFTDPSGNEFCILRREI